MVEKSLRTTVPSEATVLDLGLPRNSWWILLAFIKSFLGQASSVRICSWIYHYISFEEHFILLFWTYCCVVKHLNYVSESSEQWWISFSGLSFLTKIWWTLFLWLFSCFLRLYEEEMFYHYQNELIKYEEQAEVYRRRGVPMPLSLVPPAPPILTVFKPANAARFQVGGRTVVC